VKVYQQTSQVEFEQMGGETVLLNVTTSKFCLLNRSAAVVWNELKEPQTLGSIAAALCRSFQGVSEQQAENDTREILEQLHSQGFIVSID
jgi:hypothetical protein